MFGYVTIYRKDLDKTAMDCYQAYYCGLCETLTPYGLAARLALSYDLTFAALLLSALNAPQTVFSHGRCAPHPIRPRPRASNQYIAYAADMTVVLAYYNYLDDWQDDRRRLSRDAAETLKPHLEKISQRWPRQCESVRRHLQSLSELEAAGSTDLDALCGAFGALLGDVLVQNETDLFAGPLAGMGRGLGGFIYLMDAYDDLPKDQRRRRFNALAPLAGAYGADRAGFETRCHELLTQQMALCAENFQLLPILQDTPEGQLVYNTIYAGVWSKYALVKATRAKKPKPAPKRKGTQ